MTGITIMIVGFIMGPLEGIIFGIITDSFSVLINGWAPLFLFAIQYPFIGMLSG
jgi:hypothetical protein